MTRVDKLDDERSAFSIGLTLYDGSADAYLVLARIESSILVVFFAGFELELAIFGVSIDEVEIKVQIAA